jgi:trans-2,3-dihydro-3-hydroxyanthranilate isomerase
VPNPTFHIVDVFAERKYAGNQLAVVRGAGRLSDREMQEVALEMNYSETTFLLDEEGREGAYAVRIFTPRAEVPFAGHPTLGTASVIRTEVIREPVDCVLLDLKAGRIPVDFGEGFPWMRQLPPVFGDTYDADRVAPALGLDPGDLDGRYPVREVSTGLPAIIVPLWSLDALKRCRVDQERYRELVQGAGKNLYVFCPETHEGGNDLAARMFADDLGVPEDPATGSAAGCLAGYLVEHRYLGVDGVDVRLEQGYEIGRPSLLYLRASRAENGDIRVSVGGKVQPVARGELLL